MRAKAVYATLLALALLVAVQATVDRYRHIGRPFAGFMVMENLLVAVGGGERGGLEPFDLMRAMNGQLLTSGRQIQAEVDREPPGTSMRYILYRRGELLEAEIPTRVTTRRDFVRFLIEGLVAGLLILALGALVFYAKPGTSQSWLFLVFCLVWFVITVTYADAHTTYRYSSLFLTAWAFSPATFIHLALTFPQRRRFVRRFPRVVWIPYGLSAIVAWLLLLGPQPGRPQRIGFIAGAGAVYWGLALILLVLALARTSWAGSTPAMRQRARVLGAGFAVGYLAPVLGTVIEALFRVSVPYLNEIWKLAFVFPAAVAYAMARYDLFDVRAALRLGTIYSAVTGFVVAAYAGAIALLDLVSSRLELAAAPRLSAVILALAVVLFLNPVYVWTQKIVDRVFFRQRYDVQRSLERVSEAMIGSLDLGRIVELIRRTVEELFHPVRQRLLLYDETAEAYVLPLGGNGSAAPLAPNAPLPHCLGRLRAPLSRERLEEDPELRDVREACLAQMGGLGAELVVPVFFRDRVTGFLALGPRRSGAAYSTDDQRLLRLLANQSAVALEHAKAYSALEATNAELTTALRRVEILESIRANLAKFVPRIVQTLIEQAPEAPELGKREADVSVLFVDIVGYTRLSERLMPEEVNRLVERYFGSYLDEILRRGGDVNETAGDGLMVIFQDPDARRHARAAVSTALGILGRTREINAELAGISEPLAVHVGVNSGLATVGATKIEGVAGTRWTYTASGAVTNVAARLAGLGTGDAIMVGRETRVRLDEEFPFEALGERQLRNVEHPVLVFRLTAAPVALPAGDSP